PDGPRLPDVDPTDPLVFLEETLPECQVQVERLLRLAIEARDEIQPGQKDGHAGPAPFPPRGVHHADRLEATVRVDVEVVRLHDARIRRLESERQRVTGRG